MKLKLHLSLLFGTLLSSCSTVTISVDSMGSMRPEGRKYFLSCLDCDDKGLEFQEYASCLEAVLNRKGYSRVSEPKDAEEIVFLSFDVKSFTYQSTQAVYLPGQTSSFSSYNSYGGVTRGTVTSPGSVAYVPSTETSFSRSILLISYQKKDHPSPKVMGDIMGNQVWKTHIFSAGSTSDKRKMFPVLLVNSEEFIGQDTKGDKKFEISSDRIGSTECLRREPASK